MMRALRVCGLAAGSVVLLIAPSCSPEQERVVEPSPRAVVAVEQVVRDPGRKLRIAGAAGAWKRESLSFQVGGRIVWVIEPEKSVRGPTIDEDFLPGRDGDVIARIDPERYENALASANASLAAVEANVRATRQQLEEVLPQSRAQAETELRRASDNRDRIKRAVERNAVAATELTNAEASVETAKAGLESVRGQLMAKQSELEGLQAQAKQAAQAARSAEIDLRDTELRAPFAGRTTQVSVVPGALVQPGTAIAQLVMMDPIKIGITVSTQTARAIGDQDQGLVYTEGAEEPLLASLYQRDSITDSATRTVGLTLICRNPETTGPENGVPVFEDRMPLIQFPVDKARAWFIERRCVRQDAEGTFAWRIAGKDLRQVTGEVVDMVRMPIKLGKARKDFVGLYQFQEVIPSAAMLPELERSPGITVRNMVFGMGLPPDFAGGKAMVVRKDWSIRPGDVVDVELDLAAAGKGVYVPTTALSHAGEQPFVFVVRGNSGSQVLERVDVEVTGRVGGVVRIGAEPLADGLPIVASGTHVLTNGERVQVTKLRKVQ